MQHPLNLILSRWELEPPAFSLLEIEQNGIESIVGRDAFGPAVSASSCLCSECGETRAVRFLESPREQIKATFVVCPECGPTRLQPSEVQQRILLTDRLLSHLFSDVATNLREIVASKTWKIGRRTIGSRSRELWFVRGRLSADAHAEISRRPKTILFSTTFASADNLRTPVNNTVVPLSDCVNFQNLRLAIDWDVVESLVLESEELIESPTPQLPKRATRLAKIELLVRELKQHIRSAIDHADQNGELLPRPTQELLGRQCGLNKSDVSRCLKDASATELRVLWETADDIDAIQHLPRTSLR